jgi:hypothetical protein
MVNATSSPAVFGFAVRSEVALKFLRHGGGAESLDIVEVPQQEESPHGEVMGVWPLKGTSHPAQARLCRVPDGYTFETTDIGRFGIDVEQGRIEIPVTDDPILREQRLHGIPMILSFLSRGDISLHAAAVEVGGGAVILGAPSRFGKTTLALAFLRAGHRVLSEDMICCRADTGEAIPGPALLRLRPDVVPETLPEGLFVAAERPDRLFVGFEPGRAGSGAPVPIRAIIFLREGQQIGLEPADPVTAVRDLWALNFRIGSDEGRADSFRRLTKLAGTLPAWNLTRPLTTEALAATVDAVQRVASR